MLTAEEEGEGEGRLGLRSSRMVSTRSLSLLQNRSSEEGLTITGADADDSIAIEIETEEIEIERERERGRELQRLVGCLERGERLLNKQLATF